MSQEHTGGLFGGVGGHIGVLNVSVDWQCSHT